MFKILIVSLAVASVVLADTSFEVGPGYVITRLLNTTAVAGKYIPPDIGGNYGDNLWRQRVPGDRLLLRNVEINNLASYEQVLNWNINFSGITITHIRALNLGRQRAFVESISSSTGSAFAVFRVAANQQFRILMEVYGF